MWDIEKAFLEVQKRTNSDIDKETAYKWASRAAACLIYIKKTKPEGKEKVKWFLRSQEFYHEALEHAALTPDPGALIKEINDKLKEYGFGTTP